MTALVLSIIPAAAVVAAVLTSIVRSVSNRAGAHDSAGVAGQVKAARRRVPNTGGVAIFWAFAALIGAGLVVVRTAAGGDTDGWLAPLRTHAPGLAQRTPEALVLLGGALVLHVLGVVDDRRPLGPFIKLGVMAVPVALAVAFTGTRLFTFADAHAGGPWLSGVLTVVWMLVVVNAMNFVDNMDGLSAGVGSVACAALLAVALLSGQWFVAACLAALLGALVGFLFFNSPPASIFMGDGGSIVLGFLLAFLSVRITYAHVPAAAPAMPWHALLTPLVVLAVPLYDFATVVAIRLRQGRSPFVGDLQHLSHRLVERGLSRRAAVLVIVGFAGVTGLAGVILSRSDAPGAILVGAQVLVLLCVIAAIEFAPADSRLRRSPRP